MVRFLTNRWVHFLLLSMMVVAASIYSFSDARWRKEMQYLVFDSLNQMYPREASDQVVIVDIDDDSLQRIGQWPWPRTVLADMVANLTQMGAKAIVFDGVLAEPDRSSPRFVLERLPETEAFLQARESIQFLGDHDEILAAAIKESGIFVSGFTYASYSQQPQEPRLSKNILIRANDKKRFLEEAQRFKKAATFLPEIEKAAAGNGSFMAKPDHDGVLRTTSLLFSNGRVLYPSLSLEALRVASGDKKLSIKIGRNPDHNPNKIDTAYRVLIGDYEIPVEDDGLFYLYYRRFDEARAHDYLSAYKFVRSDDVSAGERVKDKIVFIGSSAEGLKDLRSTALEPFQPGVEIHANVVEQILQGKYLLRPNITTFAEANFILIVGLLVVLLAPFINVMVLGFLSFTLIGSAFVGAGVAYVDYGVLLDPFYPSLCVFLIFVASTILTYLRTESERQQIRDAFGFYISPEYMEELTENPEKLKLGGEIRDLSVMFTDIRSFTTISEGLSPEELIALMNDFLTPMSDLVMQNKGTIDKYMGDAMMAFWNAPLDVKDHELLACKAALGMQDALTPINEGVRAKAEELGKEPVLLQAGIGINTGPCAVGNMGSKQRFAYSTLGDAVNMASRLEGQTKTYGARILIGEATWEKVPGLASLEADLIQVKGKTKAERVFILLGDEEMAADAGFAALREKHEAMIEAYRAGEFEATQTLLKECRAPGGAYELDVFYALYEERIAAMIKNPPGPDWDGVYVATSK